MNRPLGLAAIAFLLLSSALPARAAEDKYAALKPLLGTWFVDRQCGRVQDRLLVVFRRLPKTVLGEFYDAKDPKVSIGRADIVSAGEDDRYRVVIALPNNPVLKALNLRSLAGSMVVSDDPDEPDGPGKDYITRSSRVSVLTSLVTIKSIISSWPTMTFAISARIFLMTSALALTTSPSSDDAPCE